MIVITDPLVLPADVQMVPVADLAEETRALFECGEGDYALTRPRSRTPSKVIDADAAILLKQFQSPKTIVQAVIGYSREVHVDPQEILDSAYPFLRSLVLSSLLVGPDSQEANKIVQSFEFGDEVGGCRVLYCVQVLEDTELYQVKRPGEPHAALKILRATAHPVASRMLARETRILRHLDGTVNPALRGTGRHGEQPYLIMDWCGGNDVLAAAVEHRASGAASGGRKGLVALCAAILDAYSHLHAQRVYHGDVHPRNVLVDADGTVRIVDYGLARLEGPDPALDHAERGGVGFFYDPQYVQAGLARRPPPEGAVPKANARSEQYALAAMLYHLWTGAHYLDFSLERDVMLRQIVDETPLPFAHWDAAPSPEIERVLFKALSKEPPARYASVAEFARAFREAARHDDAARAAQKPAPPVQTGSALDALLEDHLVKLAPDGALFTEGLPQAPKCSVMAGAAGIAHALYRIACARQSSRLLAWADLWAAKAMHESGEADAFASEEYEVSPETVGRVSPYHTLSGVHAVQALIAHATGDHLVQQASIEGFCRASQLPCDDKLDLTLGRASTLLGASLLLDAVTGSEILNGDALRKVGDGAIIEIWDRLRAHPPIIKDKDLANPGIAHGWAGLLYAAMRWCRSSGGELPAEVEERLAQLAELAERTGRGARWKWLLVRPSPDSPYPYMPGWCNGSAGHVYLWALAHRTFHDEEYARLAQGAAWNAWEDPQTAGSLCCGLTGRAYALLHWFKQTGEIAWLERARALAARAATADPTPDMPFYSLYKGTLGAAVLAADLENPSESALPFFEEEGWPV